PRTSPLKIRFVKTENVSCRNIGIYCPRMKQETMTGWMPAALAFLAGAAVEVVTSTLGHRREAWDSPYYFTLGFPAMLAASFLIAAATRKYPVRIGYAPFAGQLITMVLRTGGGSMLPLGIIVMGLLGPEGALADHLCVTAGHLCHGQEV